MRQRNERAGAIDALALRRDQNGLPIRWRFQCASVLIAPACEGRWRWEEPEWAKTGFPDAGVSIALACGGR